MEIMGATQSRLPVDHLIHVSLRAAKSDLLAGLIAQEMGHIARRESRHPSHDHEVHNRAMARVTVPRAFSRGFPRIAHAAINHVEDIYADDYAMTVIGTDRARGFFAEWVNNAVAMAADGNRWAEVSGALDIAFSLGNLGRHHLLPADDPLWRGGGPLALLGPPPSPPTSFAASRSATARSSPFATRALVARAEIFVVFSITLRPRVGFPWSRK